MNQFSVTFERYLPNNDEADICEADETGFIVENVSLRDAIRFGLECSEPSYAGACEPDCMPARGVRWLTFTDWNNCTPEHIREGILESRSLHFPSHISEASRGRICRMFGVRL